MNHGFVEHADRARDEQQALEALRSLSDSQRVKPSVLEQPLKVAQRQPELQGRFGSRMQEVQPQRPVLAQPDYRGVLFNRKTGRWHSSIGTHGRSIALGSFDTDEEAARVYDRAALRIRGHKAALNFPPSDYLLPDGNLALDLQVEAVLMEAFLGRGSGEDASGPGGQPQQHSTNGSGGGAGPEDGQGSVAAIGDLVRQCLGRINRADRADLQEAAEALGPGYLRLMNLITDAGQVLAAAGNAAPAATGGGGGDRPRAGGDRAGGEGGDGGGGEGGGEGGADADWVSERRENHRLSVSQPLPPPQQQQQAHGHAGSWQVPRGGGSGAAAAGAAAPTDYGRAAVQGRQQQQQPSQSPEQQQAGAQDRSRPLQAPLLAREQQHQQQHRHQQQQQRLRQGDAAIEGSPVPSFDLQERGKAPRTHLQEAAGGGSSCGGTPADQEPVKVRGTLFAGSTAFAPPPPPDAERKQPAGPPWSAAPSAAAAQHPPPSCLPPHLMQELCNVLASNIQQARQQQQQQAAAGTAAGAPRTAAAPPVIQAVAQMISSGFPPGPLLQAAGQLAASKVMSPRELESLEAALGAWVVSERGLFGAPAAPGPRASAAAAMSSDGPLRGPTPAHRQQRQPAQLETPQDVDGRGGAETGTASGSCSARGGGGGGSLKRKSADAAPVAPAAAPADARGEPAAGSVAPVMAGASCAAAGYGDDDDALRLAPALKRQHRQAAAGAQPALVPPAVAAVGGHAGRRTGLDTALPMDVSTAMAMAAAAAAASTAGGVPIGVPTAPQEQARAAAAVAAAAATAAATAPSAAGGPRAQLVMAPSGAPTMVLEGTLPASAMVLHSSGGSGGVGLGRVGSAAPTAGGGVGSNGGPVRQHIGLGRRLFNAIASQLPPGAELDCLLPPRYGFVGVLYSQPGSTRVGAALWDGGEVRDLGEYSSDRDARQSVDSAARLVTGTMRQPSPAAAGILPPAAAAAGRRMQVAPAGSGGGSLLMGRPSPITSNTAGPPPLPTVGSAPEISGGGDGAGGTTAAVTTAAAAAAARSKLGGPSSYSHGAGLHGGATAGGGAGGGGSISTLTSCQQAATVPRVSAGRQMAFTAANARDTLPASHASPSALHGIGSGGGGGALGVAVRPMSTSAAAGGGGGPQAPTASVKSILSGARSSQGAAAVAAAGLPPGGAAGSGGGGGGSHDPPIPVLTRAGGGRPAAAAATAVVCGELEAVGSSLPKGPVMGPYLVGAPEVDKDGNVQLVCQLFVQQEEPLSSDDLNNVIAQKLTAANLQSFLADLVAGSEPAFAAAAAAATAAIGREPPPAAAAAVAGGAIPAATVTTSITGTTGELAGHEYYRQQHHHRYHHQPPPISQQQQRAGPCPTGGGGGAATTGVTQGSPPMPFAFRGSGTMTTTPLDREPRERELEDAVSVRGPLLLLPPPLSVQQAPQLQNHDLAGQSPPPPISALQPLPRAGSRQLPAGPAGVGAGGVTPPQQALPPLTALPGHGRGGNRDDERPSAQGALLHQAPPSYTAGDGGELYPTTAAGVEAAAAAAQTLAHVLPVDQRAMLAAGSGAHAAAAAAPKPEPQAACPAAAEREQRHPSASRDAHGSGGVAAAAAGPGYGGDQEGGGDAEDADGCRRSSSTEVEATAEAVDRGAAAAAAFDTLAAAMAVEAEAYDREADVLGARDRVPIESSSMFQGRVRALAPQATGVTATVGAAAAAADPLEEESSRGGEAATGSDAADGAAEYGAVRKLVGVSVQDALHLTQQQQQ